MLPDNEIATTKIRGLKKLKSKITLATFLLVLKPIPTKLFNYCLKAVAITQRE